MLQQVDSPLDWSMRLSKLSPQGAQRPLDAFFRLLFIAAGKVLEYDKSHGKTNAEKDWLPKCPAAKPTFCDSPPSIYTNFTEGRRQAFQLRMLGLRFYAIYQTTLHINSGAIWEKALKCGAEFDKETRDANQTEDTMLTLHSYRSIYEFYKDNSVVDESLPSYQAWCSHFMFLARKARVVAIIGYSVLFLQELIVLFSHYSFRPVITISLRTRTESASRSRTRKWLKRESRSRPHPIYSEYNQIPASVRRIHRHHETDLRI